MRFSFAVAGCVAAGFAVLPLLASAQTAPADPAPNYPARTIRVVVPYPAGGTSDILVRLIGQKLTEKWGQQIVVEARPGAVACNPSWTWCRGRPTHFSTACCPPCRISRAGVCGCWR